MPHEQVDLDGCPVSSCEAPVEKAFKTTRGAKLTTANMVQARTCLYPTTTKIKAEDGSRTVPATFIVYHQELEQETATAEGDDDAERGDDADDDADAEVPPDPDDLDDTHRIVYNAIVDRAPVTKAGLAGALAGQVDLDAAGDALDALVEQGYVEDVEGGFAPVGG